MSPTAIRWRLTDAIGQLAAICKLHCHPGRFVLHVASQETNDARVGQSLLDANLSADLLCVSPGQVHHLYRAGCVGHLVPAFPHTAASDRRGGTETE